MSEYPVPEVKKTPQEIIIEQAAMIAKLTDINVHLDSELDKGDSWAWIRSKFEKCRTQFKWYTPRCDGLSGTRYEVMGWLHVLFAHADPKVYIDIAIEHQKKADDAIVRAESAEVQLAAAQQQLHDEALAFNNANEVVAKLETDLAAANERIAELERIIASMKLADREKADSLNSYRVDLETAIGQRDEARSAQVTDEQIGNAMREAGYDTPGTKAEIFWEAVKASRAQKGSPK